MLTDSGDASLGSAVSAVRDLLDALVGAGDGTDWHKVVEGVDDATVALRGAAVGEGEWMARPPRLDLVDRGQVLTPRLWVRSVSGDSLRARTRFGRHFHGSNGAAHGGAVPLLFDEAFGYVVHARGVRARTASLETDFRSVTPVDQDLDVSVDVVGTEGRKVWMAATLADGERLCAEATALFVKLRPEQP